MPLIHINVKCADQFTMSTPEGQEYEGYVPDFFPEQHFGDYVTLDIDTQTGVILNWFPISKATVDATFKSTSNSYTP
jgi:hypothetical protein|tara:strand:+ start:295 stop:525 length:231 start_codon:yes stop_codon:yes gene_type:complete